MTVFHELDCCVSPVNTIEEALDFLPEGRARVLTEIEHPLIGKVSQITNPIYQLFKNKDEADWFAAESRADMETLLKERGYDTEEIEALRAQNVIE